MKLKEKLKNWLLKKELDEIEDIKNRLMIAGKELGELRKIKETYDECLKRINQTHTMLYEKVNMHHKSHMLLEDCRKFMNSICDISTDVGFKSSEHSWAVICVHGKMDYVKFVDMSHRDIMEIAKFLKRFEYSNRITDSPLGYKHIIEDAIVKW